MQTFLMVLLIVVLMSPLLLFQGLPFIAAGLLVHRATVLWLGARTRLVLACGIAALGIAPAFDTFWQPRPVYLRCLDGDLVNPWAALLSFAVTWAVVLLKAAAVARRRATHYH